jgi:dihydropyrimidinase
MDLMYQGVVTGEITLERWVELTSTTPARMFGMYGQKGVIAPGADADIVVYDPAGHTTIGMPVDEHGHPTGRTHHMNMDHSAWEGFEVDGHVDTVISRGKVVVDGNEYLGAKGDGRFIRRGLTQYLS